MTWTSPHPSSATPRPPLLPERPITLGEIAAGAWRVYRERFGLFVKLLLMPFLLMLVATFVFGALVAGTVAATFTTEAPAPGAAIALIVVFYLALMVISLLVYVYQGRIVVGGIDLATGREEPTSANLAARTQGMLGRVVVLMLLALGLSLALGLLLIATLVPVALSGGSGDGGGGVVTLVLLMPALYLALIWLGIKVTYVIPVMAEERLGAWDAIKRSFSLTRGAFWRTLGHLLVLGLIALAIMLIPYLLLIIGAGLSRANPDQLGAGPLLGLGFGGLLLYAALILFVPYQYLFIALMYLSRSRELGGPPGAPLPSAYGAPYGQGQPYPGPYPYPQVDPRAQGKQYPGYPGYPGYPQNPQDPQNPWGPPPTGPAGGSTPQG